MDAGRGDLTVWLTAAIGAALLLGQAAFGEPLPEVGEPPPQAGDASRAAAQPAEQVVLYYFYGGQGDTDSGQMQAAVQEALREEFGNELERGRLAFQAIDLQDPENRKLVETCKVTGPALVLAELRDGEVVRHKQLEKAWGLAGQKESLARYVQHQTRGYLRGRLSAFVLLVGMALGLGMFTAVQPCPMATNIAAISFLARQVSSSRQVLLGGVLYTVGRTLAYVTLAVLLIGGLAQWEITTFLQRYLGQVLGPILILVAMFLLGLVRLNVSGPAVSEKMQKRVEAWGIWAALPLGVLFALCFCPVSAGCFFFSLFALLLASDSWILLPSLFGLGTALPVVAFAVLIAFSAQSLGRAFGVITQLEWWLRRTAGVVFLLVGILFSLEFCFGVPIRRLLGL